MMSLGPTLFLASELARHITGEVNSTVKRRLGAVADEGGESWFSSRLNGGNPTASGREFLPGIEGETIYALPGFVGFWFWLFGCQVSCFNPLRNAVSSVD
jgi:hypothetical protein